MDRTAPRGAGRSEIRKVRAFLRALRNFVNKQEVWHRRNTYVDLLILALLSKAIRVGEAVCTLVAAGFADEAFGLGRTLIDIALTVRYITNGDSFARSRRYAEFFGKDHEQWAKLAQKYYPGRQLRVGPHHAKMLELAKKYRSPHQWTGLGDQTRAMAMEDDVVEMDSSGNPVRWEFDYEVVYKWTSHFVHSTVSSLDAHITVTDPFRVHSGKQPTPKAGMALFNVAFYLWKICICGFRELKIELSPQLTRGFDRTIKALQ